MNLTLEQRRQAGHAARKRLARSDFGAFTAQDDARDPVEIVREEEQGAVAELMPIRYGRMLTTPFAFFRGAAGLMARDLAQRANTGLTAQLCGDAHLSNFGLFAAPDRRLVFDCNDFDETLPGPWEWDLKRLAASLVIAARSISATPDQADAAVRAASAGYRRRMHELAELTNLEVWYKRTEVDQLLELLEQMDRQSGRAEVEKLAEKAYTRDHLSELKKLTTIVDGRPRILADPPLVTPIEDVGRELGIDASSDHVHDLVQGVLERYKSRLLADRRRLLDRYEIAHIARTVVGVGSVGTRVWLVLLLGRDDHDPLFLQLKEAAPSVLEPYLGESSARSAGERVIDGQRLMQGASDPLLGWESFVGADGVQRDYYVHQLKDWKGSAKIERLTPAQLGGYGELCAQVLARAHARSGDPVAIAAYAGRSDKLDAALSGFAVAYADQNDRDYARMREAVADGRIAVREGI